MTAQNEIVDAVGEMVEQGANGAEAIHRAVAGVPFDMLEGLRTLEEPLQEARRLQDKAIGAVYDLVRGINRDVQRVAHELLETGEQGLRVLDAKPEDTATPDKAAEA